MTEEKITITPEMKKARRDKKRRIRELQEQQQEQARLKKHMHREHDADHRRDVRVQAKHDRKEDLRKNADKYKQQHEERVARRKAAYLKWKAAFCKKMEDDLRVRKRIPKEVSVTYDYDKKSFSIKEPMKPVLKEEPKDA